MMNKQEIIRNQIITISDVLTKEECEEYIKKSEQIGYEDAPLTTSRGFVMNKNVRNNTRVMIDDQNTADLICEKIKPFIPPKIGSWKAFNLNERIRYYRYNPGQFFACHLDASFKRNEKEESLFTFMIYLNDNYEGGETKFSLKYPYDDVIIKPVQGMALIFDQYLFHEGALVVSGVKYVFRSEIMYKKIVN